MKHVLVSAAIFTLLFAACSKDASKDTGKDATTKGASSDATKDAGNDGRYMKIKDLNNKSEAEIAKVMEQFTDEEKAAIKRAGESLQGDTAAAMEMTLQEMLDKGKTIQ